MSQRTRKSLAGAEPTTPQRVTRVKSEAVSTTPQRTTRKSIVNVETAVKVQTPTRRTRSSSVSSVLSDVSDIVSESGRVTRRSSRLSGIKLEEIEQPAELLGRKRTSSISSVTSETPSQSRPTTRRSTSGQETPSQSSSSLDVATPSVAKNRLLEGSIHEDSPFKVSSTRKSRKLSLPTVAEDEVVIEEDKEDGKVTLSTKQLEEINFSSDNDEDSVEVSGNKKRVDRKRKSILPAKNDQLNTIDEDECEIGDTKTSPKRSPRISMKDSSPAAQGSLKSSPSKITPKSSIKSSSKSPVTKIASPYSQGTPKSSTAQVTSKSPAQVKSKSPAAKETSKSPSVLIEKKQISKENEQHLPAAEKSPANISNKKTRKSSENKGDGASNSNIVSTENLKRKSIEAINDKITPKKSLGKANSSISKNEEDQERPISIEEITVDDDDDDKEDDVDMEEKSNLQSNKQEVETTQTNPQKRKSKSNSEVVDAIANAKKRKSQDHTEGVKKSVESDQEDGENKENNLENNKEEMLKQIKLEKAKAFLDEVRQKTLFRKKHSEREKQRQRERKLKKKLAKKNLGILNKTGMSDKNVAATKKTIPGVLKPAPVEQTSMNTDKPKPKSDVDEQRRLEKILQKKALKKQKWLKRLAEKKAADETRKREQNRLAKNERKKVHEEAAIAKQDLKAKMTKKRRPNKKKKSAVGATPNVQAANTNDVSSNKPNITLSDIIAKIDAMTQSKKSELSEAKKVLTEHNDTDDKSDDVARGKAKSGRFWKDTKEKFSTMVKTPGLRRPHSEKEKLRAEIKHNKEMTRHILDSAARAKEEHRQRRAENIKRREENAKKAEIVQVIKNPAKLKRMKKKQLRLIEKRDTLPIIEKKKAAATQPAEA